MSVQPEPAATRGTFSLLLADGAQWGQGAEGYALLDSGEGRKLERFGPHAFDRPDGQAIWAPTAADRWRADAVFESGAANPDGEAGEWRFRKGAAPEAWPMRWGGVRFFGRCTAFRHMGVFPEHAVHWQTAAELIKGSGRTGEHAPKVLNLFGYSGVMSLVCAEAGAQVTHVDASPKAIGYGRENAQLSGLADKPIRWLCEDAMRFVEREARRGNRYDGIVLDPPKHGRGPKGEIWRLEEGLGPLLRACCGLLSDRPLFLITTVYAVRMSFLALGQALGDELARLEAERGRALGGRLEWGEMAIAGTDGRLLPTALHARWLAE